MWRYITVGAAVGVAIAGSSVIADLRTPRDFSYLVPLVLLSPLYLPVGAAGLGLGISDEALKILLVVSNGLLYAGLGAVLWNLRARSIAVRVAVLTATLGFLHLTSLL